MNQARKPVAVVVGATSKWQSDGRNTRLAHGRAIDDSDIPVGMRWGVGGAIAQKFAREGFFVVLTTRRAANASALEKAIIEQGGESMIVELDLVSRDPRGLTDLGVITCYPMPRRDGSQAANRYTIPAVSELAIDDRRAAAQAARAEPEEKSRPIPAGGRTSSDAGGRSFASQLAKVQGADIPDDAKKKVLGENLKRLLLPILKDKGMKP